MYFLHNRIFYGWVIAAAGFLLSVIGIGTRYSYGVFLTSIEAEFAMTRGASSIVFSVYMLLCCLTSGLGGWALDRFGPKKVGICMGIFTGASLLLTSRVTAPWQLFITYSLLLSLGTGAMYVVVNSTASRWFVKKRGVVVGLTSSGGGVGIILLAPFATYLISDFNWRTAMTVIGLIAGVGIVGISWLMKKDPDEIGLLPDGDKPGGSRSGIPKEAEKIQAADFSLRQTIGLKLFWFFLMSWLFMSLSLHMVFIHVVPYAVKAGISPMDAAFVLSLTGFSNIFGRLVVGRLSDHFGRRLLGSACGVFQFAALICIVWAQQLWVFYAFALIFGFMWGGYGALATSLMGDIFGTRNLGYIMGIINSGWALGAALGPAIGGYVFDLSGSYTTAFLAGAVSLLLSAGFLSLVKKAS